MKASPIRVVLVDDHQIVVDSFSALLQSSEDFEVVGTATTPEAGVERVLESRPDIALFDVDFPGRDSFDVIPGLIRQAPRTAIAFLTGHVSDVFIHQAVRMKARGYLLKREPSDQICSALKRLHSGERVFSPEVLDRLVWDDAKGTFKLRTDNSLCALNVQQLAILRHLARGESVKEIAAALDRTEKSIDSHKYRIMHRLGIHDRVELCRYAIREGLALV